MHTRTIASLLMNVIESAMTETPPEIPMIIGTGDEDHADIVYLSDIHNEGSFYMELDDGSKFRIDVVRYG